MAILPRNGTPVSPSRPLWQDHLSSLIRASDIDALTAQLAQPLGASVLTEAEERELIDLRRRLEDLYTQLLDRVGTHILIDYVDQAREASDAALKLLAEMKAVQE